MDPQLFAATVIRAAVPGAIVDTLIDGANAVNSAAYVWVDDAGGSATRPGSIETPSLNLVCYSNISRRAALDVAHAAEAALAAAWLAQTVVPGSGHLTFFRVSERPTLSPVDGLPGGVHRYFASYSMGLRP